jgi:hypothetical protein
MAKKKSSNAVRKDVTAVPCEREMTTFLDQSAKNNFLAGEKVVVVENPLTTPSTSDAAADARRKPEPNESTISYAET